MILVGAGPGDPDLITVRGAAALAQADVVLYDQLATGDLLDLAPARALRINVGKRGHDESSPTQEDINRLIVEHARAGRTVVRLKGGDPLVFGRGGEEMSACADAGIPFEIVPGVTSAIAAPAYAGIPVTDRRHSASFAVVTGHKDPSARRRTDALARARQCGGHARDPDGHAQPAAARRRSDRRGQGAHHPRGGRDARDAPQQRTCVSTLEGICEAVEAAGLGAPSAVIVGGVVGLREGLSWWERRPLFGKQVLITRAREQSADLAGAIRATGAMPVVEPMIELAPIEGEAECAAVDAVVADLGAYTCLVFTSSNAVRFFVRACGGEPGPESSPPPLAPGARVFCIGEATARAALDAGMPVHLIASGRSDAEALLAQLLPALPAETERVLIPRSRIARTVIADGIAAAGIAVDSIAFYENRRPVVDDAALRSRLIAGELDALTFTSPSTVDHFLEGLDASSRAAAGRCMIIAIGRTTARRLEEVGLPVSRIAARPDVPAIVEALVELAADMQ